MARIPIIVHYLFYPSRAGWGVAASCWQGRGGCSIIKALIEPGRAEEAQERQLSMTATRETIEVTAGEVAAELKRRGIGSDKKVTLTIEPERR